jgi:hypothetical protein
MVPEKALRVLACSASEELNENYSTKGSANSPVEQDKK